MAAREKVFLRATRGSALLFFRGDVRCACPAYDGEEKSIAHRFHDKPQKVSFGRRRKGESDSICDEEVLLYDE